MIHVGIKCNTEMFFMDELDRSFNAQNSEIVNLGDGMYIRIGVSAVLE